MKRARLLYGSWCAATIGVALLFASPGLAQQDASDALESAVQLFDEGDYVGAQHALKEINADQLSEDDRASLQEYVQRAALAVSMQEKAQTDHEAAALAVSDGRMEEAKRLLQSVLDNQYAGREMHEVAAAELKVLESRSTPQTAQESQPATEGAGGATEAPGDISIQLRSLRAKVLTRDGNKAMRAGRLSEAERLFREALANVPGHPEAEKGLRELGQYERVESGAETLLERIRQRNEVAWQRTVATFRFLERQVRGQVLANRYDRARAAMLRARQVVESGRGAADPVSKYEALLHDAQALERYVEQEKRLFNEGEVMRQREEARRENQERVQRIRKNKEKRIGALMSQALQHRKDRNFEASANVLRQVLAVDPQNDTARWMLDSIEDQQAYAQQHELRDEFMRQSQKVLIDVDRSKIPWWQELTYPKNWLEIISRPTRTPPGSEMRGIDANLQSRLDKPVRIDFQGTPFKDAVQMLAEAGDANISVSWSSLAGASVKPDTPVSLTLANPISLGTALREVLDNVNGSSIELGFLPADGVIKIASRDVLDRTVYEHVYSVSDLLMPIPDFDDAPDMDLATITSDALAARKGSSQDGGAAIFPEPQAAVTEEQIKQEANELIALICKTIDPDSWRSNGGDIGSITEINGQLVITQTPSGHARIGGLLSRLREQRAIQVAIEARFITVQSNYLEELGLDLDIMLNAGNAGFDFVAGQGGSVQIDPVLGSRLLLPRSFSRLGFAPSNPVGGTPLTTLGELPQPFGQPGLVPGPGSNLVGGSSATPVPVISNVLQFTDPGQLTSDLPGSFAGNPTLQPAFNIFGSFLDNIQVDFLIRATQADSRTTIVTAPRLVLFNGQRAWVAVVNQQSFVSSLEPVVDADGSAPIVSTIETGAVLDAQATVTADRRYVTMTLRPSIGRLLGIQTFGFSIGPNVGEGSFVQLPSITRTVLRTTVSIPDGGTLLIGGQKLAGEIEIEGGVPILSKIPILKRLYSSRTLVKDEQVLLILIKPKIIIPTEAEEEAFPTFSSR